MRCFIAVVLPEHVRALLARVRADLAAPGMSLRWANESNLHLTLKFLGEVADDRIPEVVRALSDASSSTGPFEMEVRGLGTFPPRGPASVLWAGCHGEALAGLHAAIEAALDPLGFEPEGRPFRPHVTLARAAGVRRGRLDLDAWRDHRFAAVRVDAIELMQSELLPEGARHTVLHHVPLHAGN